MFEHTRRVSLELSNRCNYARQHTRCPTSTFRDVKILPLDVIKSIVADLKAAGWGNGMKFAFHVYNEPGIDPRLYWLIRHVKEQLPGIKPFLTTNGWYLNGDLAREFFEAGLDHLFISIYSKTELVRLKPEISVLPYHTRLHIANLKQKLLNPGEPPKKYRSCFSPLSDLTIRASGNIGLCCLDYNETVVFGNVREEPLRVILEREYDRMLELYNSLRKCKRVHQVCILCPRRRPPIKLEIHRGK